MQKANRYLYTIIILSSEDSVYIHALVPAIYVKLRAPIFCRSFPLNFLMAVRMYIHLIVIYSPARTNAQLPNYIQRLKLCEREI